MTKHQGGFDDKCFGPASFRLDKAKPRLCFALKDKEAMSHQMASLWCRLDIDVQLVTRQLGGFDNVRVRAALFRLDEGHPNGCSEVLPAVEVEVKDKNHWISLDANTKRSHKVAGVGGLALVRA